MYHTYVVMDAVKDFFGDLCRAYTDEKEDAPLHYLYNFIKDVKVGIVDQEEIVVSVMDATFNFIESNRDHIINNRWSDVKGSISLSEDLYVEVERYLNLEDENFDAITTHITTLQKVFEKVETREEAFLTTFFQSIGKTINKTIPSSVQNDGPPSDEAITSMINDITTDEDNISTIQNSLTEFTSNNLDENKFVKLLCFKAKDFLDTNGLDDKIDVNKDQLDGILNKLIQYDVDELMQADKQRELIAMLSGSGLLTKLLPILNTQLLSKLGDKLKF